MRTTLIFDFDGVLVDSLKPMLSNAGQVCRELGYPCQPSQADLEALDRMEFSEFGRQLGIPEEKIGAFVSRNFELFSLREEPLEITPGIDSVIRGLSTSAFLALITGNSCAVVRKFLDAHGMEHEFQAIELIRSAKLYRSMATQEGKYI
jgi:beta-phosphoglucomutase-like phosphatase (HAD superfamily)